MDLLNSVELLRKDRILTPFDRWVDDLHFTCGSFRPSRMDKSLAIRGEARRLNACGIEFSHISNDLDQIERDWTDVRRDAVEQVFLIVQLEGSCGVEHRGALSRLDVGDCILVDSTRPTLFHFGGQYSNHLSLNLSQEAINPQGGDAFMVGKTLAGADPMAVVLRALATKVLQTPETDLRAEGLRQLMVNATREAFRADAAPATSFEALGDTASRRLQMVDLLIDQNLNSPYLSAKWLATRVGVSMRILQLHFQGLGMTCTTYIREKRLREARTRIERIGMLSGPQTIAEIAYSVGFNDLSYFNRCFKESFDCAPSDVTRPLPGRAGTH